MPQAEERNKRLQELNRFVHYYTRFKNHENSYKVGGLRIVTRWVNCENSYKVGGLRIVTRWVDCENSYKVGGL